MAAVDEEGVVSVERRDDVEVIMRDFPMLMRFITEAPFRTHLFKKPPKRIAVIHNMQQYINAHYEDLKMDSDAIEFESLVLWKKGSILAFCYPPDYPYCVIQIAPAGESTFLTWGKFYLNRPLTLEYEMCTLGELEKHPDGTQTIKYHKHSFSNSFKLKLNRSDINDIELTEIIVKESSSVFHYIPLDTSFVLIEPYEDFFNHNTWTEINKEFKVDAGAPLDPYAKWMFPITPTWINDLATALGRIQQRRKETTSVVSFKEIKKRKERERAEQEEDEKELEALKKKKEEGEERFGTSKRRQNRMGSRGRKKKGKHNK